MGRTDGGRLVIRGVRGRDGGTVSPLEIPPGLMAEVLNLDLDGSGIGTKRGGHFAVTINNAWPGPGSGPQSLLTFQPGSADTGIELWGLTGTGGGGMNRLPLATDSWASVTLTDAIASETTQAMGVSFGGKFYIAYDSAVDRLHVYDPTLSAPRVRRVGLAAPAAAPTVADTGSGSYAATQRWYQVSYRIKSGAIVVAEGERSASVAFTPSGSGTHAQVTKPASISESETHWVLWASETGTSGPFYQLAETVVGTTTYDDNTTPSAYDDGTAAQVAGTFTTISSVKYILNDGGNRLLFAGAYESGGYTSRVWFTPALHALDRGDDERTLFTSAADGGLKYYVDLDENNGGGITGFGGPLNGQPIVFKERQVWRLVPTGDVDAPYQPRVIAK